MTVGTSFKKVGELVFILNIYIKPVTTTTELGVEYRRLL